MSTTSLAERAAPAALPLPAGTTPAAGAWKRSIRMHWLVDAAALPVDLRAGAAGTVRAELRAGFHPGPGGRSFPRAELLLEGRVLATWGGRTLSGWDRAPGGGLETVEICHDTGDVILHGSVRRAGAGLRWKAFLGLYRAYAPPREGTRDCYLRGGDALPAVPLECDLLETDLLLEAAPWLASARYAGAHFAP